MDQSNPCRLYRRKIVPSSRTVLEDQARGGAFAREAPPGARDRDPRRVADVLGALVLADVQERYGRGPLRVVKWLIEPFALVGVYLLLVSLVLDRPDEAPGLSLACAVVPFQLVMTAVVNALNAVNVRKTIIVNMAFPRLLIPLVSALTASVVFVPSLVLVAIMMAAYGVAPAPALAWLPAVLAVSLALAVAFSYAASLIGLWFFDLRSVAVACVRILFFVAPGLVALDQVHGDARDLLPLNPLTGLFESYRDVFLYGHSPSAWELLYPLAAAVVLLAALLPLYDREQRHFAKVV
jgi:lipopolysaccharide transport system permease protein